MRRSGGAWMRALVMPAGYLVPAGRRRETIATHWAAGGVALDRRWAAAAGHSPCAAAAPRAWPRSSSSPLRAARGPGWRISAVGAPSLAAHGLPVLATADRAGDGAAEQGSDRRGPAPSRSPRTSPRRARSSGPPGDRRHVRGGGRAAMATSRSTRHDRTGHTGAGGTTSPRSPGTPRSPSRSAVPAGRPRSVRSRTSSQR